jgi:hypothetical protein
MIAGMRGRAPAQRSNRTSNEYCCPLRWRAGLQAARARLRHRHVRAAATTASAQDSDASTVVITGAALPQRGKPGADRRHRDHPGRDPPRRRQRRQQRDPQDRRRVRPPEPGFLARLRARPARLRQQQRAEHGNPGRRGAPERERAGEYRAVGHPDRQRRAHRDRARRQQRAVRRRRDRRHHQHRHAPRPRAGHAWFGVRRSRPVPPARRARLVLGRDRQRRRRPDGGAPGQRQLPPQQRLRPDQLLARRAGALHRRPRRPARGKRAPGFALPGFADAGPVQCRPAPDPDAEGLRLARHRPRQRLRRIPPGPGRTGRRAVAPRAQRALELPVHRLRLDRRLRRAARTSSRRARAGSAMSAAC